MNLATKTTDELEMYISVFWYTFFLQLLQLSTICQTSIYTSSETLPRSHFSHSSLLKMNVALLQCVVKWSFYCLAVQVGFASQTKLKLFLDPTCDLYVLTHGCINGNSISMFNRSSCFQYLHPVHIECSMLELILGLANRLLVYHGVIRLRKTQLNEVYVRILSQEMAIHRQKLLKIFPCFAVL